jgi:hypothetical protein
VACYDPATGAWSTAIPYLAMARMYHTATLLPDGKVLVAGGWDAIQLLASAELYDPAQGTWTSAGDLNSARMYHSAVLLADGTLMLAFGAGGDVVTEIYVPR